MDFVWGRGIYYYSNYEISNMNIWGGVGVELGWGWSNPTDYDTVDNSLW